MQRACGSPTSKCSTDLTASDSEGALRFMLRIFLWTVELSPLTEMKQWLAIFNLNKNKCRTTKKTSKRIELPENAAIGINL